MTIAVLNRSVHESLAMSGVAFLPSFRPSNSTHEIAALLGAPQIVGRQQLVQSLRPHDANAATPNTYSGAYGLNAFPLHTDLAHWRKPPRYFLLRCVVGSEDVPTPLIDGRKLLSLVPQAMLERALMRPRRPKGGKLGLLPLYQRVGAHGWLLRWDERYIVPASAAGKLGRDAMAEAVRTSAPRQFFLKTQGDTLIVDNWRVLHGRGAVTIGARDRVLERCYMEGLS